MPSLIDLRRRIRSVKNTQQITKAMKMVSAAKLRRVQDRVVASRPYAKSLGELLANAAAAATGDEVASDPLLAQRPERRIQVLILTGDRGLAGALNTNLFKAAQRWVSEHGDATIEFEVIGRKARDYYRRRSATLTGELLGVTEKTPYAEIAAVAGKLMDRYRAGEVDAVYLIYNEFKSMMSQTSSVDRLLPVTAPTETSAVNYIYEQPPAELLRALLPRYVEVQVYRAVLESIASDHAARMMAMESATKNSGEVIDKLTLYLNRVRQASITKEIIEVVSGASVLE